MWSILFWFNLYVFYYFPLAKFIDLDDLTHIRIALHIFVPNYTSYARRHLTSAGDNPLYIYIWQMSLMLSFRPLVASFAWLAQFEILYSKWRLVCRLNVKHMVLFTEGTGKLLKINSYEQMSPTLSFRIFILGLNDPFKLKKYTLIKICSNPSLQFDHDGFSYRIAVLRHRYVTMIFVRLKHFFQYIYFQMATNSWPLSADQYVLGHLMSSTWCFIHTRHWETIVANMIMNIQGVTNISNICVIQEYFCSFHEPIYMLE